MAKKCPPGVFCIENVTFTILILLGVSVLYIGYYVFLRPITHKYNMTTQNDYRLSNQIQESDSNEYYIKPGTFFSNLTKDVFLNPYSPPLKENRFLFGDSSMRITYEEPRHHRGPGGYGVPINMQTSHYDMEYRQMGILTRQSGKQTIIPLFGRPLHSNRNKWQYYTMTENNNMIKLPVSRGGRSCTDDVGCDELYNGDNVYVEGYQDTFKVTVYENDKPRYIPYL
jgi:hypothetical protein